MGEHAVSNMAKELAIKLGKDPSSFTENSIRRLAVNKFAEAGASVTGLQMAEKWKRATTPMEHMENTKKCNDRMIILDGEELVSPPKKLKASGNYGNENEVGVVVQNNCTVINVICSALVLLARICV